MEVEFQNRTINREISWLSFNYRVLQEAKDTTVPLLERIKFLAIFSSNLDEFYRVRVAERKARLYERDRVCNCGACSTAHHLTLKFVVHYDQATVINVNGHINLIGRGVILTHRFLKNSIEGNEYILISEKLNEMLGRNELNKYNIPVVPSHGYIDHSGLTKNANFLYYNLSELHKNIKLTQRDSPIQKFKNSIKNSIVINAPMKFVHKIIADVNLKKNWAIGLKEQQQDFKLPRVGSNHICISLFGDLDIQTTMSMISKTRMGFAEKTKNIKFLKKLTNFFIIEKNSDNSSTLAMELHYTPLPLIGWIIEPIIRSFMRWALNKSLRNAKVYVESNYEI